MSTLSKILRDKILLAVREAVDDQWQASEGHRSGSQISSSVMCRRKCISWRYHGKMDCDNVSLTAFSYVTVEEPQPGVTLPKWEISLGLGGITAPVLVRRRAGRHQMAAQRDQIEPLCVCLS